MLGDLVDVQLMFDFKAWNDLATMRIANVFEALMFVMAIIAWATTRGKKNQTIMNVTVNVAADAATASEPTFDLVKLHNAVEDMLDTLTPQERRVLQLLFGLIDGRQRSRREVGYLFGVNGSRIYNVERRALKKLRHPSRSPEKFGIDAASFAEAFEMLQK